MENPSFYLDQILSLRAFAKRYPNIRDRAKEEITYLIGRSRFLDTFQSRWISRGLSADIFNILRQILRCIKYWFILKAIRSLEFRLVVATTTFFVMSLRYFTLLACTRRMHSNSLLSLSAIICSIFPAESFSRPSSRCCVRATAFTWTRVLCALRIYFYFIDERALQVRAY